MTGMETASMICLMSLGLAMRATPPSARIMAGTRSSAMTEMAPASSAMRACSTFMTSMMTPPLSISARPVLRRRVEELKLPLVGVVCHDDSPWEPRAGVTWFETVCRESIQFSSFVGMRMKWRLEVYGEEVVERLIRGKFKLDLSRDVQDGGQATHQEAVYA